MLTATQAAALKAAIQGDATVAAFVTEQDWPSVAANYNAPTATPIWKQIVPAQDIIAAILPADFIALTTGGQLAMVAMLSGGFVDATKPNIDSWFSTVFAGKATTLANLTAAAQRPATKFETLAAFLSASVSSVYGIVLTAADVQAAMGA